MEIIYSDADIIVVNKPPGISVHPALINKSGTGGGYAVSGPALVDDLVRQFPEIVGIGDDPLRPGIVHRLDRDTSGIMVIARNQESFSALKLMFQRRSIEKTYRAIVCGVPARRSGVIDYAIGRMSRNPTMRGAVVGRNIIRGARDARTEYRVVQAGTAYSVVELHPKTGRMHQLRVHMRAIGHPIACDTKYGGKNVCCPLPVDCRRQLLHAESLAFSFPLGRRLFFHADPPPDFTIAEQGVF